MKLILWLLLLVISWPVALLALVLYPIAWVLMLPFRLVGVTVSGVFELIKGLITLPVRVFQRRLT